MTKSEFINKTDAEKFDPETKEKVSHEKLPSEYDSLNSPLFAAAGWKKQGVIYDTEANDNA